MVRILKFAAAYPGFDNLFFGNGREKGMETPKCISIVEAHEKYLKQNDKEFYAGLHKLRNLVMKREGNYRKMNIK